MVDRVAGAPLKIPLPPWGRILYAPVLLTAGAAGGYGIRPYVFVLAFGPKLHIFYYFLSIIFYLYIRSDNPH